MTNMMIARLGIVGTRPLLFNSFGPDAIPLKKGERSGVAGNDPEEWRRRRCWNEDRQLCLPSAAVFACLRDGARFTRKGRGSLQPLIVATLQVSEEVITLDRFLPESDIPTDPAASVYIDVRGVRMKATGAWNVRYRVATSKGWRANFQITWDKTILSRGEMQAICIDAGKLVGIGDGRKLGFGRFDVDVFGVENAQAAPATRGVEGSADDHLAA
jgi:hypothetical protein